MGIFVSKNTSPKINETDIIKQHIVTPCELLYCDKRGKVVEEKYKDTILKIYP